MSEVLNFIVNSPEKFILQYIINLYCIKNNDNIEEKIKHQCWLNIFNCENGEKHILTIMQKLYPNGTKIDVQKINEIFNETLKFLETDKNAKETLTKYYMYYYKSYVYSIYNNQVIYAAYGQHCSILLKLTQEFFGNLDNYTKDEVYNFIMKNFKIKGSDKPLIKFANHITDLYGI